MVIKKGMSKEVLLYLFRNPSTNHTITALTENLNRSRVGIWKTIKNLEKDNYIILTPIELLKRKVYTIKLNWDNALVEMTLGMYLIDEALKYEEWTKYFNNLGNVLEFLILCKEDNNDKILGITQKGKFIRLQKPLNLQGLKGKEIITSSVTSLDFMQGLRNKKEDSVQAVNSGIILFGQEKFVQFMKQVHNSLTRL